MAEFDPIPPINPFFKGLVMATLLVALVLVIIGIWTLGVAVLA